MFTGSGEPDSVYPYLSICYHMFIHLYPSPQRSGYHGPVCSRSVRAVLVKQKTANCAGKCAFMVHRSRLKKNGTHFTPFEKIEGVTSFLQLASICILELMSKEYPSTGVPPREGLVQIFLFPEATTHSQHFSTRYMSQLGTT